MNGDTNTPAEDLIPIGHMLIASGWALSIAEGRSRRDFEQDLELYLALIKAVEIIGEAATRVSGDTQNNVASIPWPQIIGMRNRLVHGYDAIRRDRVWQTVREHLPLLMEELRRLLPNDFIPSPLR